MSEEMYEMAGADEIEDEDLSFEFEGPIELDLDAVRDEPVAIGWHIVKIERAEAGLSKKQRLPKVFILSRILDEADRDFNRTLIWNIMLKGDGLLFTKRCLRALGFPGVLDYEDVAEFCSDLLEREVEVQVKHRFWEGEKQANINNWRPVPSSSWG